VQHREDYRSTVSTKGGDNGGYSRSVGVSPSALPRPESFPDLASLRAFWDSVQAGQQRLLDELTEERLQQPVEYVNLS